MVVAELVVIGATVYLAVRLSMTSPAAAAAVLAAVAAALAAPHIIKALDAERELAPEPVGPMGELSSPGAPSSRQRRWLRSLGRAMARVNVWILIVGIVG